MYTGFVFAVRLVVFVFILSWLWTLAGQFLSSKSDGLVILGILITILNGFMFMFVIKYVIDFMWGHKK